jgi:dTDP-4-amino-4,6-dideoxygalactose transaminase
MIAHSRPWITAEDVQAVADQLAQGMVAQGAAAKQLEHKLAARFRFADAVVVGSACQALLLALKAVGVQAGSKVALPTYVCPELLGVLAELEAVPFITDINEDFLLDEADLEGSEQSLTAIILPSLFGRRARLTTHLTMKVPVIHDWAQYIPPNDSCRDVDIAIVSLGATKMLAAGEGGAVLVSTGELGEKVRQLKQSRSPAGCNLYPLSDLQAALAISQISRVDAFIEKRKAMAACASQFINEMQCVLDPGFGPEDVPFRFPLRLVAQVVDDDPTAVDRLIAGFESRGIAARRPVRPMLHQIKDFQRAFPRADAAFAATFSLPFYPCLPDGDFKRIWNVASELLSHYT